MKFSICKMVSAATMLAMLVSPAGSIKAVAEDTTVITKYYTKYDVSENTTLEYPLSIDVNSSVQSRALIDTDDRVRDGNSGIVYLSCGGTGFIVDDHTIATAAHCVNAIHSPTPAIKEKYADYDYFCYDINVFLYNDSGNPSSGIPLTPIEFHVPNQYISTNAIKNDYALITVAEDLSGYTHFNLGVPYNVNESTFASRDLFVTGIPQSIPDDDPDDNDDTPANVLLQVYTSKGKEHPDKTSTQEELYYTCDTVGGNSGGPVYIAYQYTSNSTTNTIYTAIAVHKGGAYHWEGNVRVYDHNYGSAMTPYKIQFYKNNPNISY